MLPSDILGLDMGVRTGFAFGAVGRRPESGVVILKRDGDPAAVAFSNLIAFLVQRFDAGKPMLVCKEEPFNFATFAKRPTSMASVRVTYGLHAVAEGVCARFGVPWHEVPPARVRKHFTGQGNAGDRDATKAMVVRRCQQLGYMDTADADDDRADACSVWDWACAHLARTAPRELVLFPPKASK